MHASGGLRAASVTFGWSCFPECTEATVVAETLLGTEFDQRFYNANGVRIVGEDQINHARTDKS